MNPVTTRIRRFHLKHVVGKTLGIAFDVRRFDDDIRDLDPDMPPPKEWLDWVYFSVSTDRRRPTMENRHLEPYYSQFIRGDRYAYFFTVHSHTEAHLSAVAKAWGIATWHVLSWLVASRSHVDSWDRYR